MDALSGDRPTIADEPSAHGDQANDDGPKNHLWVMLAQAGYHREHERLPVAAKP
jgi:hypothetical protein